MSDETNPLDDAIAQAMDAFVYAPIGLVFDGPALFPKLVQSGRNQVNAARMMGPMAVQVAQGEATKRVARVHDQFRGSLAALGLLPDDTDEPASDTSGAGAATTTSAAPPKPASTSTAETAGKRAKTAGKTAGTASGKTSTPAKQKSSTPARPAMTPDGLAIPDYDSLSASQVVKRLRGLATSELDAVKAYESSTRARKTILNRITQLQKD